MTSPTTRDARTVRSSYAEPGTLRARGSLYQYRRGTADLRSTVADILDVRAGDRFLDLGCGEGPYFDVAAHAGASLTVGLDASWQMLQRARRRPAAVVQASLDALPLRPRAWDVILAAHSLYHADAPLTVLDGLPRLLRPGGRVYLVLNGKDHLVELRTLAADAGHPGLLGESNRCTADAVLAHIGAGAGVGSTATWLRDELVVPDVAPLVAYLDSTRAIYEPRLGPGTSWALMLDRFAALARSRIEADGAIRIRAETAVIRCP